MRFIDFCNHQKSIIFIIFICREIYKKYIYTVEKFINCLVVRAQTCQMPLFTADVITPN